MRDMNQRALRVVNEESPAQKPSASWWLNLSREDFNKKVKEEMPRMQLAKGNAVVLPKITL